jgi:hypothetical protein
MIYQLTAAEEVLFDTLKPCHYTRRIKSHFLAYSIKYDFSRLFVIERGGKTAGVISLFNASMMVTDAIGITFTDDEIEDLAIFIRMNMPYSVELDPMYAERLEPLICEFYNSDLRTEFAYSGFGELPALDINECPNLDDVFSILREGFPSLANSYELWITDTSHRVRRGLSQSFLMGDYTTATIQYIIDKTALIGHVATRAEYRGHYHARRLLYWIGERLTNDGFDVRLFARPHRVSYYEEIGFAAVAHDKVFELKKEYQNN